METNKREKGNKVIAEFMDELPISEHYDLNWNSLMRVVEKIEKEIKKVREDFTVSIIDKTCIISVPYTTSIIVYGETKINAVWLAVIQYIEQLKK